MGQQGYGQSGYGQQGFEQQGYGQQEQQASFETSQFPAMGESDQPRQAQGYQTEAYPQQGFEPGYAQNGQGLQDGQGVPDTQNGYTGAGPESYGHSSLGQPPGPGSTGSQQDAFSQGPYGQDPFAPNGTRTSYPPDAYSQNGFRQDANGAGGYSQDAAYVRPGPGQPGGAPPGGDDIPAAGTSPRSGGPRSAQRLGGIRMVLYLLASVVGVVVIVLLVVHLTKTGSNSPAAGSPTSRHQLRRHRASVALRVHRGV